MLTVSAVAPWLAVAAWNYRDYVLGPRGILQAIGTSLPFYEALVKEWRELFYGFLTCLPFTAIGCYVLAATRRYRCFLAGILTAWLLGLLSAERYSDVPVQLPVYALLCTSTGIGLDVAIRAISWSVNLRRFTVACPAAGVVLLVWLRGPHGDAYVARALPTAPVAVAAMAAAAVLFVGRRTSWIRHARLVVYAGLLTCLTMNACLVLARAHDRSRDHHAFKQACLALQAAAGPDFLLLSEWSRGILFEHYVFNDAYTRHWINMEWMRGEWGAEYTLRAQQRWREALQMGHDVWLLRRHDDTWNELTKSGYEMERFHMFVRATPAAGRPEGG